MKVVRLKQTNIDTKIWIFHTFKVFLHCQFTTLVKDSQSFGGGGGGGGGGGLKSPKEIADVN